MDGWDLRQRVGFESEPAHVVDNPDDRLPPAVVHLQTPADGALVMFKNADTGSRSHHAAPADPERPARS